jgi:diguanylate cyclase (GGDEF)-like protein
MNESSGAQCLEHEEVIAPPSGYRRGAAFAAKKPRVTAQIPTADADADTDNLDALTGLPNLAHLAGIFRSLMRRARRSHHAFALISLDLDEFRSVCEAYGCDEGDSAVKSLASILCAEVGPHEIVVCAGASKFIVVMTGLASAADAIGPVRQILAAIAKPRDVGGQELRLTASAGIAIFPIDGTDYETLLRNSNAAMHESQSAGHGDLRTYSGNAALDAKRRLRLRMDLCRAVENCELTLHYQPQFEVLSGRACGVEVLARWFRVNGDAVEPRVFIPLAEQTGLIGALGAWVLQQACETVAAWHVPGELPPTLCVNVSTHQIDENMCDVIRRAVERAAFPAERLELEITESSLMRNPDAVIECLRQWRKLGVRIAVDDFGTGYSSLSYLSRLPVDRLKLDRSLIRNLTTTRKDAAIVRSMIALGKDLDVEVIAEGVETEQQFRTLRDLGCLQVQGYLLARPGPALEAQGLLMSRWGMRHAERPGQRQN